MQVGTTTVNKCSLGSGGKKHAGGRWAPNGSPILAVSADRSSSSEMPPVEVDACGSTVRKERYYKF